MVHLAHVDWSVDGVEAESPESREVSLFSVKMAILLRATRATPTPARLKRRRVAMRDRARSRAHTQTINVLHTHARAGHLIRLSLTISCYTRNPPREDPLSICISDIVSFDSHLGAIRP